MKRRRQRRYRGERFCRCDVCNRLASWEDALLVLVQGAARFTIAIGCSASCAEEARRRWPLTAEECARFDFRQFAREHPELVATVVGLAELELTE
jgi:hypothetical protein